MDRMTVSPLSKQPAQLVFEGEVLGKHRARYFYDPVAKYIFVEEPHWLEEAYASAIALTDTGILVRNERNIEYCSRLFRRVQARTPSFRGVDLGAGYGIFVRGMRDRGFDFYWHDLYAENLLARGFEAPEGRYHAAVAFEVLEHAVDPLSFLATAKANFGFQRLVFSATCFEPGKIPGKDWWYWAFETGQHVSFFSVDALAYIAAQLGMNLRHLKDDLYLMEDLALQDERLGAERTVLDSLAHLCIRLERKLYGRGRTSLTWSDHEHMRDLRK